MLEANQEFLSRLYKWQLDENTVTGEPTPVVKLIDFDNPAANHFVAINQFRIDTPGQTNDHIRPDIVLFVNGLPLVVIECKDVNAYTTEPLHEAVEQLRRYADLREDTIAAGLREGDPRLFFSNQLMIATHGNDCRVGSITSTEEFYYQWRSIYPDERPYVDPVIGVHRLQEQLVQGMLKPATLLDITRSFLLFMDAGAQRVKVICRYQQYRAANRIVERLRAGKTSRERSGVVWHTQGSGKSLTMVFLVRRLRRCEDLKDFKVLMVNDRRDLEEQLTTTATLTGEKVAVINSSEAVKEKLKTDASNLNMVMVHKFREADESNVPLYVKVAIKAAFVRKARDYAANNPDLVPRFLDLHMFEADLQGVDTLSNLLRTLQPLVDNLEDSLALTGSEAYQAALVFYRSVKSAALSGQPNAKTIADDLSVRFPTSGRAKVATTNTVSSKEPA